MDVISKFMASYKYFYMEAFNLDVMSDIRYYDPPTLTYEHITTTQVLIKFPYAGYLGHSQPYGVEAHKMLPPIETAAIYEFFDSSYFFQTTKLSNYTSREYVKYYNELISGFVKYPGYLVHLKEPGTIKYHMLEKHKATFNFHFMVPFQSVMKNNASQAHYVSCADVAARHAINGTFGLYMNEFLPTFNTTFPYAAGL